MVEDGREEWGGECYKKEMRYGGGSKLKPANFAANVGFQGLVGEGEATLDQLKLHL